MKADDDLKKKKKYALIEAQLSSRESNGNLESEVVSSGNKHRNKQILLKDFFF